MLSESRLKNLRHSTTETEHGKSGRDKCAKFGMEVGAGTDLYGSDTAIRVSNLSKYYQIYDMPRDRLKQFIIPRFQRLIGRDPSQFFREFWALNDVSIEIRHGETVGIIGRNGSGKSTLLQIICGTVSPTNGTVETNGRIAALLELGSGFNPEFTGRENVYMNAAVLGLSKEEIDSRFQEIAAFADLGDFIEQPVKSYSSGMVVRLAFSVAINVDPEILVVDEALSVGDELFQRKCFSKIEHIKKKGATILFVSHSGTTIIELCDKAVLLDAGEKLIMGHPKEVVGKYQKLLYASSERQRQIREEIHALGGSGAANGALANDKLKGDETDGWDDVDEVFDPALAPQSTLSYESRGACIEEPEIFTLSGKKINCLKRGGTYRYTYRVRFDRSAASVRFGMLIKTKSGLELGGLTTDKGEGKGISIVHAGEFVKVEFLFRCSLNAGIYFTNSGVSGCLESERIYLHRLIDAYCFRVSDSKGGHSTGVVDFEEGSPKVEMGCLPQC